MRDVHGDYGGHVDEKAHVRSWRDQDPNTQVEEDKKVEQTLNGVQQILDEEESPEEKEKSL